MKTVDAFNLTNKRFCFRFTGRTHMSLAHENDLFLDWLKNAWHYRLEVKLDVIGAHSSGHHLTLGIGFTLVVQLETLAGDWGGASFKCNRKVNILRNETSI